MTISSLTLSDAAALVPMTADRLAHWAELGYVPGAKHAGKRKHWAFNRDVFLAGLIPLQVMLADVERRGTIDGTRRNPATGLPFVAGELEEADAEVRAARARGPLFTVTDRVTVTPVLTVQEHIDSQQYMPWWSWERSWVLPVLVLVVGSLAAYFWRF